MKTIGTMKRGILTTLLSAVVAGLLGTTTAAADPDDDFKKMPGYVDFSAIGALKDRDAKVEVFLKGPLLQIAVNALKHDDPDLADILAGLQLVRVQVYDIDDYGASRSERRERVEEMVEQTKSVAKDLDNKGWEVVVKVREKYDHVDIFMLPGKKENDIDGLVVMVVGDDDEAVFVNIVGTINADDIGRVIDAFDDDMIDIDWDDHDDDGDRRRSRRSYR